MHRSYDLTLFRTSELQMVSAKNTAD